ncbi:MAG: DUF6465 family protein [Lachnospiraceae bacterium]|nr:DUF6465 family protein [Lachnospiraceae bacterium]
MAVKETSAVKIATTKDATKKIETKAGELKDAGSAKAVDSSEQATSKVVLKTEIFLQLPGRDYTEKDLIKKVKEVWTKSFKRKVEEMETIQIYLKPEDNKAYFVVNGNTDGDVDL